MTPHESLMRLALEEAGAAFREGEVPVGAVVAKDEMCIRDSFPSSPPKRIHIVRFWRAEVNIS